MLRLLCVTAHPDDEAGGFGGTFLLCRERGIETSLVCLTAGGAASHRGSTSSAEELMATRRRELASSCKILGITRHEVLDYPDGRLDRQDFYAVTGELTRRIRQWRPHVVVTFGGEGAITAHTDHGMASLFTTAAFHAAARTNRYPEQLAEGLAVWHPHKLYYATAMFTLEGRQPVSLAPCTCVVTIGPEKLEQKIQAFQQHRTQSPLFELVEAHMRKRGSVERFHLVASSTPGDVVVEDDLFAGITGTGD